MLLILFSAKCQTLLSFTALYSTKWTKAADEPPGIPPGIAHLPWGSCCWPLCASHRKPSQKLCFLEAHQEDHERAEARRGGPSRPGCWLSFSSQVVWGLGKKWLRRSLKNPLKELAIFDKMQLIKLFKCWIIESNTSRALVWLTMGSQVLFLQLISKSHRTVLEGDISCVLTLSKNLICRHGTT